MTRLTVLLLLSVVLLVRGKVTPRELTSFIEHEIVPDVISVAPKELVSVSYPNGVEVLEGNELLPSEVGDAPSVEWDAQPDKFYTLIMCDADVPSREVPEIRSLLHWQVVNIPGSDVNKGETIMTYIGSRPEPLTGLHRYIFLIYEQPSFIEFEEKLSDDLSLRFNFLPEDFANKYNFGAPVAGNFYQAKNFEDLVEIVGQVIKIKL